MRITLIGMIYRSLAYLDFMVRGMLATPAPPDCTVNRLIVANDATPEVLAALESLDPRIPFIDYRDKHPQDYYLNRVYRAWNVGGRLAIGDVIVFVNSDMWPAEGWLERLIANLDRDTIPCSRLIESGKMESGEHAISRNFGQAPATFDRAGFDAFAGEISQRDLWIPGGLYMPCAFYKSDFLEAGGYPEGNIYSAGPGRMDSRFIRSGDDHFFHHNPVMAQKRHVTVFDSLVYHFQSGEMDE